MTSDAELNVLLVDDNPGDVRLLQLAFDEVAVSVSLQVATDGAEALTVLRDDSEHSRPVDLLILDLHLPKTRGTDVLRAVRNDTSLHTLPVLIHSSSAEPADIEESYALGATTYLRKRMTFTETLTLVETITEFWFERAELPQL